jgi:4-hydroxythreonine-4-phosphate dehydrogenase
LGDPQGIGPEIIYKSLAVYNPRCPVLIIGGLQHYPTPHNINTVTAIEHIRQKGIYFFNLPEAKIDTDPSFEYVKLAAKLALKKQVAALVTAPISKEKWLKAGIRFAGHTGYLAHRASVKEYAMCFWSKNLLVALFSVHIPLKRVFTHIRKEKIINFIRFLDSELHRLFGRRHTFFVSGLNPHAGEQGIIGKEEINEIIPAVKILAAEMDIQGPIPADTVFLKARQAENAVVVAWYHDQGLIPFKLLNVHAGVNLTLGLPFIRTSPDHGTAYDITGKGIADPSSMTQAIQLAERLIGA